MFDLWARVAAREPAHGKGGVQMSNESAQTVLQAAAADPVQLKLEDFLPYRLNLCANSVSQALSRLYTERYKFGIPEWRVLVTVGQFGNLTAKAIGQHGHMHKTKVSRAVAMLEQRKLLARRANRNDLREAFLSLTPAGREIYDALAPMALDFVNRLIETVEPSDRAALDRALKNLTDRSSAVAAEFALRSPR